MYVEIVTRKGCFFWDIFSDNLCNINLLTFCIDSAWATFVKLYNCCITLQIWGLMKSNRRVWTNRKRWWHSASSAPVSQSSCFSLNASQGKKYLKKNNLISLLFSHMQPSIYWGQDQGSKIPKCPENILCRDSLFIHTSRGELWQFQSQGDLVPSKNKDKRGGVWRGRIKSGR